jgi:hypothetical protein
MKITNANGVTGLLLNPYHQKGKWVFRVTHDDKTFTDYVLRHSDMCVTIHDTDAVFYEGNNDKMGTLDHSPETLGIKEDKDVQ